jgi:amidase
MARTVKDAAYVLQAIAGEDSFDNYTSAIPFKNGLPDYVAACNFSSLKGKRIGIPRNLIYREPDDKYILSAFTEAISVITGAGATVLDNTNITADAANEYLNGNVSGIILDADFASDLPNLYLSQLSSNPHNITNVQQLRAFTQSFPAEDYPDRDTGVWDETLKLGFNNTSPKFWPYYQRNLQVAGPEGILGVLANHSLDALILPTDFSPDFPARLGTPVVTVPMGFYPENTTVIYNSRKTLVSVGPQIP